VAKQKTMERLLEMKMVDYYHAFEDAGLWDLDLICESIMSEQDLENDLNITNKFHRRKLLKMIEKRNSQKSQGQDKPQGGN